LGFVTKRILNVLIIFLIPGSFFPPRELTKSDLVHVYDKDLCRVWALRYRKDVIKDGVNTAYYTPDDNLLETVENNPDNACFCEDDTKCTVKGLQYIGPCQFSKYRSTKNHVLFINCFNTIEQSK